MKPLTNKQQKLYQNTKIYVFKEKFEDKQAKNKIFFAKPGTIVIIQGNIEVLQMAHVI